MEKKEFNEKVADCYMETIMDRLRVGIDVKMVFPEVEDEMREAFGGNFAAFKEMLLERVEARVREDFDYYMEKDFWARGAENGLAKFMSKAEDVIEDDLVF